MTKLLMARDLYIVVWHHFDRHKTYISRYTVPQFDFGNHFIDATFLTEPIRQEQKLGLFLFKN